RLHLSLGRQRCLPAIGWRMTSSADPLRELDDDPFRPADVAEPIEVFVTLHLADELRAPGTEAGDHGVDVVDRECDVPDTRGVRWGVSVAVQALRCMELHEFEATVAVRDLNHRDLNPDALEPTTRSTQAPSTRPPPCSLNPRSTKNAVAAARSST